MRLTRRGRLMAALGILLAIVAVLSIPVLLWLRSIGLLRESSPDGRVTVRIPKGAGTGKIGELLEDNEVVPSAIGFRIAVYLEGGFEGIQAGEYTLARGLSAKEALAELEKGPKTPPIVRVTFPEGSWVEDFAATVDDATDIPAKEFERLATSGRIRSKWQPKSIDTLEGLLFPSTYDISEKQDASDVVERLVAEFDERYSGLRPQRAEEMGVTPYEAVIVVSMIEAEAYVDEERAKIASVIYNRLDAGIRLGIDATIHYALGEHKEALTTEDLQVDSPYNTREVAGLPPTPIGAPGEKSLAAALNPADTDLFYYVLADCAGHHAFSETYDEFLVNKAAHQELEC